MASFGERLKELRIEYRLTQEELADKFYLNKSSISRYERNQQVPELDLLQKIADFFKVGVDYLLGNSDIKNPYENVQKITDSVEDDPELLEFWEVLKEREDLQLMFKQVRSLSRKDIKQIIRLIKAVEDEEDAEN